MVDEESVLTEFSTWADRPSTTTEKMTRMAEAIRLAEMMLIAIAECRIRRDAASEIAMVYKRYS